LFSYQEFVTAFGEIVAILPPDWPGPKQEKKPGDLGVSEIVPQGIGWPAPPIFQPWDTIESLVQRPNYYAFDPPANDPLEWAPRSLASGGVIYFDDRAGLEKLDAALEVMGVWVDSDQFGVFAEVAQKKDVSKRRFLHQIRIVSSFALSGLFKVPDPVIEANCKQAIMVRRLVRRFIEFETKCWLARSATLRGTLGGDGDWAKEWLSFGFLVENSFHGVYRLWSRPWLATK
jgi:hypothetical protein